MEIAIIILNACIIVNTFLTIHLTKKLKRKNLVIEKLWDNIRKEREKTSELENSSNPQNNLHNNTDPSLISKPLLIKEMEFFYKTMFLEYPEGEDEDGLKSRKERGDSFLKAMIIVVKF